jgi:uncharacterized RDD family membrane protein YckC
MDMPFSRLWRARNVTMACPICGKRSRCVHEKERASARVNSGVAAGSGQNVAVAGPRPSSAPSVERAHDQAWRQEVVVRVRQHRAKRHRYDPSATMSLDFPEDELPAVLLKSEAAAPPPAVVRPEPPKLIQFPRPLAAESTAASATSARAALLADDLELAAPVLDAPRILYAAEPEQMDLLSSFADIRLEAEEPKPHEPMELPPRAAALRPRMLAGLVDLGIVLAAGVIFATIFLVLAGMPSQRNLALISAVVACGCLWLVFQCIFLVYGQATPGMRLADLELCTFAGEKASLRARAGRALASTLSAFSLGLGFAWALVDEDALGWHDRMTQTHVRKQIAIGK